MLRKKSFLRKKKHLEKNTMGFFNENKKSRKDTADKRYTKKKKDDDDDAKMI